MDIQLTDEEGKNRLIIQDFELSKVLQYAENWSCIDNNRKQRNEVFENIFMIKKFLRTVTNGERMAFIDEIDRKGERNDD